MRRTPSARARAWLVLVVLALGLPARAEGARDERQLAGPADARVRPAAAPRRLPALDHEPLLQVLLARGSQVTIQLEREAALGAAGLSTRVGPGPLTLEAHGDGWRLAGAQRVHRGAGILKSGDRPIFALDATPLFGEPRRLRVAGDLIVRAADGRIEIIERVPMEAYLVSVVAAEMNPSWPPQALAAQAIVARSYAAARWMDRHGQPWHLHWHFGVDMAYHGWSADHAPVARAIAPTRGEVLVHRGLPVLALFHASSGGRTEAFDRVKPGVRAPDGRTPIAAAMPVVEDSAAMAGASGLGLDASHGRWKADIPLPEVTRALQAWSSAADGRPAFGAVEGVSVLERHADSERVARVSVRHRLQGETRFTALAGADFRLAVGPVRIRSLRWDRCVVASQEPGYLVLKGRGFGHGCGLSQVSAWYLATRGESAEAIVARFYAGARIERRY